MKSDRDWDIARLEVDVKNSDLIGKWLMEKAGGRIQQPPEPEEVDYGINNQELTEENNEIGYA